MKAVFLDLQTFSSDISLNSVTDIISELATYKLTAPEQVIERCIDAEIIISNKVVISKDMLCALPKLKLVCIAATGYNNIDLEAAKELDIAVTNVSGYAGNSIAQYVFSQVLSHFNQNFHYQQLTEQGKWQQSKTFCIHSTPISELTNKTLGIIGYGTLGKTVENLAIAFGMKVLISEHKSANQIRAGRTSFDEVIKHSDILTLHCPLTTDTENLIDKDVFKQMKPDAMLVNCARGGIVNEVELLQALQTKEIAFAALDVLATEPPYQDDILINAKLDNLTITPHIAWASIEAQQRLIDSLAANIRAYINNECLNRLD